MFCKLLQFLIEHAPTPEIKAHLQAAYDAHCGGAVANSGGGGNNGQDPDQ
ncbi:MAG: hypothetical protein ABW043_16760 [Devosia sp.]